MKRLLALPVLLLPAPALADASLSAEATGAAEYSDNVYSLPEDAPEDPIADQILSVRPSLKAALETRGLALSAAYTLSYYHYQNETDLSRAFHRLESNAAVVWWDGLQIEAFGRMDPRPASFVQPIDDPINQLQQAAAGGFFGLRHEFGRSTRGSVGVRAEQVLWLEAHENDEPRLPPEYRTYGPELSVERDVGRRLVVGADYQYQLREYDEDAENLPATGNYAAHQGRARIGLDATDWLSASLAVGFASVDYEEADPATRTLADARLSAGGDVARLALGARQFVTQDVFGNPAEVRTARIGADYTPYAPWGLGIAASYGALVFDEALATEIGTPDEPQAFVLGEANVFYKVSVGVIELAASHHESLPEGDQSKIVVNRASVRLGGRF